jgi:hypothetical protein
MYSGPLSQRMAAGFPRHSDTMPVVRNTCIQRIAVATPGPNRSAAARRDDPAYTAATTRLRRSSDKVFAIPLLASNPSQQLESDYARAGQEP